MDGAGTWETQPMPEILRLLSMGNQGTDFTVFPLFSEHYLFLHHSISLYLSRYSHPTPKLLQVDYHEDGHILFLVLSGGNEDFYIHTVISYNSVTNMTSLTLHFSFSVQAYINISLARFGA